MDTSEKYIKMCDCPEIQKDHTLKRWEATGDPYDVTAQTYNSDRFYTGDIWLPRQDPLQEMVRGDGDLVMDFMQDFMEFATHTHHTLDSMEQLWLAFVMKEKYNKTWNGEEWE